MSKRWVNARKVTVGPDAYSRRRDGPKPDWVEIADVKCGGLKGLIARPEANLQAVTDFVEKEYVG